MHRKANIMYVKRSPDLRLKEAIARLNPQDHPCLIYQSVSEKNAVVVPFLKTGLDRGERCFYIHDGNTLEIILDTLAGEGIDASAAVAKGALVLIAAKDFYPAEEAFETDKIFALFEKELVTTYTAGFTGLRAAGEIVNSFHSDFFVQRLIEYDSRLNYYLPAKNILALCMYNRDHFTPETLIKVIRAHPKVIYNGVICRNHSYLPPEEFFSPERRGFMLEHLLHGALSNENMLNDLQERKALLKTVVENTTDAVYVKDSKGRYLMINQAGAAFVGRSMEEILGRDDSELFQPDSAGKIFELDRQAMESDKPLTSEEELTAAGSTRTYLSTKGAYRDSSGNILGLFGIARDITGRKRMEKSLQESEELFHTLCEAAPLGIFKSDCGWNNLYTNQRWEQISGLTSAESLGQGWLRALHPEDREILLQSRKNAVKEMPFSLECRIITPDGKTVRVRILGSPLKNPDGQVTGYVGTIEDITELQEAKQEMLKAQKLESLGVLAGGIAHDFNNILSAILGNVSLAQFQIHDAEKIKDRLVAAEKAALRATDLTRQLLTFARGGEPVKSVIEIGSLLKEGACYTFHDPKVKIELKLADDLWPVEADKAQLNQVIHNLVVNAVQAMPQGGTIRLNAKNLHKTERKKFVEISVTDSGAGIPEEHLEKIFDPYFTTKENGTGLGLTTCYSIVNKHGGQITVSSNKDSGSTFHVYLPALDEVRKSEAVLPSKLSFGHGRILVMDDEEQVRTVVKAMLEALGYEVECASDGAETLDIYRKSKDEGKSFTAVILDLTIPCGIGGKETIASLLEIDPDVKGIVSSGYSSDPVMANFRKYGFCSVLTKPYRIQEISEVLNSLL